MTKASIDSFLHEKCKGVVKCPYCTSGNVVKWSLRKDGTRRYKCKDCRHTFVLARNTVFYYAKKDLATSALYAESMKEKTVIRRAAGLCRIGKKTSFLWRHKILDSLQGVMDDVKLDGIVEADEAFFPISYKGSRCLPRVARRRGEHAKKRGLSNEKVCVPCAVNRDGKSVSVVSNLGKVSRADLENVFCSHVVEGAVWCSDKEHSYQGFAEKHSLNLIQFKSDGKRTCGMFHIQHVNAYHSQLKSMIEYHFKGVATKYLNNYLLWQNFYDYGRGSPAMLLDRMAVDFTRQRKRGIWSRSPLPLMRAA